MIVDDGEAGEATIIQARARMYYLDKSTSADGKTQVGWRERGVGVLKVNVPVESVRLDPESGAADPKSFNPSVLEESTPENPKLVRLLMRQDSTLRVILNSAMLAGMEFVLKEGLKAHSVLFTAIEGEDAKHVQVQMKVRTLFLASEDLPLLSALLDGKADSWLCTTDEPAERRNISQVHRQPQEENEGRCVIGRRRSVLLRHCRDPGPNARQYLPWV